MKRLFVLFVMLCALQAVTAEAAPFTDNGNGTVTDNKTGLMWQQGEPGKMTWGSALSYCEGLTLGGNTDWRLPNTKELESLTDDTRYNPAIDTTFFPGAYALLYWSSTTYAYYPYSAWYVHFYNGEVGIYYKYSNYYVRCVRGGQSGLFDYFCDDDADSYIDSSIDGTCTGDGCVPAGCQTTPGDDCNDSNLNINPGASEVVNDGIDNDCNPATPVNTVSGIGMNTPAAPKWRATMSVNVDGSGPSGTVKYYYTRQRVSFQSTSITSVTASGGLATIAGIGNGTKIEGSTTTYCNGCSFTATIQDGSPDKMDMEIDAGSFYDAPGGLQSLDSRNFTVVGE